MLLKAWHVVTLSCIHKQLKCVKINNDSRSSIGIVLHENGQVRLLKSIMCFNARVKYYMFLEQQAYTGHLDVSDIIRNKNSLTAIRQKYRYLTNFVIRRYSDFIALALQNDGNGILEMVMGFPEMIFHSLENQVEIFFRVYKRALSEKIDIHFKNKLIRLLGYFIAITKGEIILKIPINERKDIFENFLFFSKELVCDELLFELTKYRSFKIWIVSFDAFSGFVEHLKSKDKIIVKRILKISLSIIDHFKYDVYYLTCFVSDLFVNLIIQLSHEQNNTELCFKFLYAISQSICINDKFIANLLNNLEFFYNVIINCTLFTITHNYVVKIICFIVNNLNEFSELILKIFNFLMDIFFQFPNNSFLHNSFNDLFKALSENYFFEDYVKNSNIQDIIIFHFKNFNKTNGCYWGQLYKITSIINLMINNNKMKSNDDWDQYLFNIYIPMSKIIDNKK